MVLGRRELSVEVRELIKDVSSGLKWRGLVLCKNVERRGRSPLPRPLAVLRLCREVAGTCWGCS